MSTFAEAVVSPVGEGAPSALDQVLARPMIAVLPFVVREGDADAGGFGAAMAYDLAGLFARWCWFPVVSTASTREARALGTHQEIGQRLGARFLVDGSVTLGDPLRIHVRLDDTHTDTCLWTARYESPRAAFFETQHALCAEVVASVYPMLVARVQHTPLPGEPEALTAWERAHAGMALQATRSQDSHLAACRHFDAAIASAPELVLAHFGLGLASYDAVLNQWAPRDEGCARLLRCADTAIALAPNAAEGFYLRARHHQTHGEVAQAREALSAAVTHNPSFAMAHALLAQVLQMSGESDAALVSMRYARQLSPRSFVAGLSVLHFVRREYELALSTAERCLLANAGYPFAYLLAAASAHYLGDAPRARAHVATLHATHPGFDPSSLLATFGSDVDAVERLVGGVQAARA